MEVPSTGIHPKAVRGQIVAGSAQAETGQMKRCTHGTRYAPASLDHTV